MTEVRLDTTSYFFPDYSIGTVRSYGTVAIGLALMIPAFFIESTMA